VGYGWQNQGWGGGAWIGMIIMMILFWGFLIVGVTYVVRHFNHQHYQGPARDSSAIEALKMRFARGEIDEDEYQRRLKMLKDGQ
jgi:putative membrane protein